MKNKKQRNAELLFDAIGTLDDRLLQDALTWRPSRRQVLRRACLIAATLAVCLALAVSGTLLAKQNETEPPLDPETDRGTESILEENLESEQEQESLDGDWELEQETSAGPNQNVEAVVVPAPYYGGFTTDESFLKPSAAEIAELWNLIPDDNYESYPLQHNAPISATLYKNGQEIPIDANDPRLIRLINFFNNTLYYKQCAYTQSNLPLAYLEENVTNESFRLELHYEPYGDRLPSPYGTYTSTCDTIILTGNTFFLINRSVPGYEFDVVNYPILAIGVTPLASQLSWLAELGF